MPCLSCGDQHFAAESVCPRTGRRVDVGPVGSTVGPYRVGKLLGAGGFGSVYRAVDSRNERPAALKLLHPDLVTDPDVLGRFMREAEATARAQNPHIVRVFEASFTDRTAFVASRGSAAQYLRGERRRPARAVSDHGRARPIRTAPWARPATGPLRSPLGGRGAVTAHRAPSGGGTGPAAGSVYSARSSTRHTISPA